MGTPLEENWLTKSLPIKKQNHEQKRIQSTS